MLLDTNRGRLTYFVSPPDVSQTPRSPSTRKRAAPARVSATPSRRRTPKRERDPEDKRERILKAARDLFASRGYGATGTSHIARAAGVSEGLIFLHFESKQGILRRIATDYGRGMAESMQAAVASSPAASAAVFAEC